MPSIFNRFGSHGQSGPSWRLALALLIVYLVWGTTYFALAVAMQSLPPLLMNGARFVAAGLAMLAIARWQGLAWPTAAQWRASALIGGLMAFAAMALVVLAQKAGIGSGLMATVVTTMPMWLALWTRWGGERVPVTSWLGLVLGAAGALLLALEGDFSTTLLGTLCAFGAPLAWSLGSYASRKLALPPPAMASAAQWLLGGMMCMLAALLFEPDARTFQWAQVSMASALAWLYLVVMGTMVTLNAYLWLLKNTSAALAGSYSFVNPVVALAVGVWLGGERLTGWVFIALPLIGVALALILYGRPVVDAATTLWRRLSAAGRATSG
ncbi:MAG: EamA family transporter [Hydrogenophaga sp.]|uniref:EamA family transporter n=1 Tax=Hydrogenophaga sp. TaxID=1904254 RepID=UPI0016A2BE67|nr:EamA family transporter [Hydrogenophaga sp.]NIM42434.1 EamA family transporter [Hydrogenophaga sp.]NIN27585.1 EamA family transporter [Hydrogenophaga sp.]NIN32405.1 EamA family transporter [Hydrogenophaga sp.]NIN56856.1 EamA family transporter [Hydrogenophaga sp.]NIO53001.1 EamA family transporter [Hydrogenophaga sp.]